MGTKVVSKLKRYNLGIISIYCDNYGLALAILLSSKKVYFLWKIIFWFDSFIIYYANFIYHLKIHKSFLIVKLKKLNLFNGETKMPLSYIDSAPISWLSALPFSLAVGNTMMILAKAIRITEIAYFILNYSA